jgi:hypothetical protein
MEKAGDDHGQDGEGGGAGRLAEIEISVELSDAGSVFSPPKLSP